MANDPALQALANMLIQKQRAIAQPGVTIPSTPPRLPAFQPPGQTMNAFAPMPNAASLYAQYQLGQKAQTPQVPPQAAPVASPDAAPLPSQMPAADTTVPPMPAPTQIGAPAPAQQPSALSDVWQALMKLKGQSPETPAPWTVNFGNYADQMKG